MASGDVVTSAQLAALLDKKEKEAEPLFGRFLDVAAGDLAGLPQPVTLAGPYFPAASVAVMSGRGGAMKSFVAQSAAMAMATGRPWGPHLVGEPMTVVYWALEGRGGLNDRFIALTEHYGIPEHGRLLVPERWPMLDNDTHADRIRDELVACGCRYLFIDTLNRAKGKLRENDADDLGSRLYAVLDVVTAAGIGVCLVHHAGWTATHSRGSSALEDNAAAVYRITRDGTWVTLDHEKSKDDAEQPRLYFDLEETAGSVVLVPATGVPIRDEAADLLEALDDGEWHTTSQLVGLTGMDRRRVAELLRPMVGRQIEKRSHQGRANEYRRPRYARPAEMSFGGSPGGADPPEPAVPF